MTTAWKGTIPIEQMREEQVKTLTLQGFRKEGDVWVGDGYFASTTDRFGDPINPEGEFNCLVIEYWTRK